MRTSMVALLLLVLSVRAGTETASKQERDELYIKVQMESIRDEPNGRELGTLLPGARMAVLETADEWVRVSVEGWVWRASTTSDPDEFDRAASVNSGPELQLLGFSTKTLPVNLDASRYSPAAILTLSMRNNTNRTVKAWKGLLVVSDPFGEELFQERVADGRANIDPGRTRKANLRWEDNQFIEDEPYDFLAAYSEENLRVEVTDIQLSQDD